jgi:phosphoserine phosphatase
VDGLHAAPVVKATLAADGLTWADVCLVSGVADDLALLGQVGEACPVAGSPAVDDAARALGWPLLDPQDPALPARPQAVSA